MRISCPSCCRILEVPDAADGQVGTCPNCGLRLRILGRQSTLANSYAPQQATTLADEEGPAAVQYTPEPEPEPVEYEPQRPSLSGSIPLWGTFLIVLIVFLGGIGWGGWRLYDTKVRQPRFEEIRELYSSWVVANLEATSDHRTLPVEAVRLTIDGKPDPVVEEANRREQERLWRQEQERRRQRRKDAQEYDRIARERFGVPASELGRLLPEG